MPDYKAFDSSPNITFSGAGLPTQSELGAKTEDIFQNTLTGELFVCDVQTFGSQVWLGSQGNNVGLLDPILDPNNPNLVAFYTMDNISGSTLVDESPNNRDGFITGATTVAGHIGDALTFNGTSNKVESSTLDVPDIFSASMWFKTTTATVDVPWSQNRPTQYRAAIISAGKVAFFSRDVGNGFQQIPLSTISVDDDVYHHIVFSQSGVNLSITIDDSETNTLTMPSAATGYTSPMRLGVGTLGIANFYTGDIDQLRVFDRLLTTTEITALFNEGTP
jgi:hypothetical protein